MKVWKNNKNKIKRMLQNIWKRKVLKDRADQHLVIVGGGVAPYLSNTAMMTAPDGVSLPSNLAIVRGVTQR